MEQMQGMDASFVALEQRNAPMHIGSILIYDPSTAPGQFVRFKDILSFIESRLKLTKTMRRRMVRAPFDIDYPYWVEDEDFDIEYHIRHVALPKPGDWRQLCIQAARIFARPLDLTRPPWELTVIEGLDNIEGVPKGAYAIVSKVHHAAIDGLSGIEMMQALNALTPDTTPPPGQDTWAPEKKPNPAVLFAKGYGKGVINPVRQLNVARQSLPGLYRATMGMVKGEFGLKSAIRAPRTRFNSKISPNRVVEGVSLDLSTVKALRALSDGAKVNDVMLAIIGGGLHKYLSLKEELPKSSMTAMAPISVRNEREKGDMGNQVSAMIVPLGTHIGNAADRLAFVCKETKKSKAMTNALGARQMTEISKVSPSLYMGLGARLYTQFGLANHMKPVINTVVTNVPGPPVPIYSAGAQMVSMHGLLCLVDGVGLGHVVQSYVDQATICFTACRKMMPDPEVYAACLREAFEEYCGLAGIDPVYRMAIAQGSAAAAPVAATPRSTTKRKPKCAAKPDADAMADVAATASDIRRRARTVASAQPKPKSTTTKPKAAATTKPARRKAAATGATKAPKKTPKTKRKSPTSPRRRPQTATGD